MYKQHAQNTIGKGGYSFIKTGSKGTVKLFTKSPAKVAFIQFLGLDRSTPEQVAVRVRVVREEMTDCGSAQATGRVSRNLHRCQVQGAGG